VIRLFLLAVFSCLFLPAFASFPCALIQLPSGSRSDLRCLFSDLVRSLARFEGSRVPVLLLPSPFRFALALGLTSTRKNSHHNHSN
jgi:hypothetical protein